MAKWMSHVSNCDICDTPLSNEKYFVDGATVFGPWALMCPICHDDKGKGLGPGKGQKYDAETLEKIEG